MGPKLLPANRKDNSKPSNYNDSPVTFSVYDVGQLQIIANARDYGICKGNIRLKQKDGTWSSNGQCNHYVDKRVSEFCDKHRRQQGSAGSNKRQPVKKMQQLKAEVLPVFVPPKKASSNRFINRTTVINNNSRTLPQSQQKLKEGTMTAVSFSKNASIVSSGLENTFPMRMKKQPVLTERETNPYKTCSIVQRFMNKRKAKDVCNSHSVSTKLTVAENMTSKRPRPTVKNSGGDWLKEAERSGKNKGKSSIGTSLSEYTKVGGTTKRTINTGGGGFDGSVLVPGPSKIFASKIPLSAVRVASSTAIPSSNELQEKVLQQQAELAQKLQNNQISGNNNKSDSWTNPETDINRKSKNSITNRSNQDNSFLSAFAGIDQEKVRNAKSRFANEIEAEEYAKSRRKVEELEKLEASKEKNAKNKSKEDGKRLIKYWICKNCEQTYKLRPQGCYSANHEVLTKMDIKKETTKEEKRTKLHNKRSEDGGLQLGSGLEWSQGTSNRFIQ
jgi:hypothetical protein